jgi:hypothetical protein
LCGEGVVALDLFAQGPEDEIDGRRIVENFSHGQLLVAGWGTFAPAAEVRRLAREHKLYLETFLGAVYPIGAGTGAGRSRRWRTSRCRTSSRGRSMTCSAAAGTLPRARRSTSCPRASGRARPRRSRR